MTETDLFNIIYSCRSMRRLKPDPVPLSLIYKVIEAGTQGPSGGGVQAWRFVVVTDARLKERIAEVYRRGWRAAEAGYAQAGLTPENDKNVRAAAALAAHLADAPVLLVPCLRARKSHAARLAGPDRETFLRILGGSIYPAVQNVLLACRAVGLGASLTTITTLFEAEMHDILGLPDFITTYALIPIGYPHGRFGPVRRRPVEAVTWLNRYGTAFPKPASADDAPETAALRKDGA